MTTTTISGSGPETRLDIHIPVETYNPHTKMKIIVFSVVNQITQSILVTLESLLSAINVFLWGIK